MDTDIFSRSFYRVSVGSIEFKYFKDLALPEIKALAGKIQRFRALEDHFSFHIDGSRDEALQLSFGCRSMLRKDAAGKAVEEKGAALLYTLGPTGEVAVTLRPATSSLAEPVEEQLRLRSGWYSGQHLARRLHRDLKDLVAYSYVTSLDAEATPGEKLRVWWLRHLHPVWV